MSLVHSKICEIGSTLVCITKPWKLLTPYNKLVKILIPGTFYVASIENTCTLKRQISTYQDANVRNIPWQRFRDSRIKCSVFTKFRLIKSTEVFYLYSRNLYAKLRLPCGFEARFWHVLLRVHASHRMSTTSYANFSLSFRNKSIRQDFLWAIKSKRSFTTRWQ